MFVDRLEGGDSYSVFSLANKSCVLEYGHYLVKMLEMAKFSISSVWSYFEHLRKTNVEKMRQLLEKQVRRSNLPVRVHSF